MIRFWIQILNDSNNLEFSTFIKTFWLLESAILPKACYLRWDTRRYTRWDTRWYTQCLIRHQFKMVGFGMDSMLWSPELSSCFRTAAGTVWFAYASQIISLNLKNLKGKINLNMFEIIALYQRFKAFFLDISNEQNSIDRLIAAIWSSEFLWPRVTAIQSKRISGRWNCPTDGVQS